jgi:hypothetical protein
MPQGGRSAVINDPILREDQLASKVLPLLLLYMIAVTRIHSSNISVVKFCRFPVCSNEVLHRRTTHITITVCYRGMISWAPRTYLRTAARRKWSWNPQIGRHSQCSAGNGILIHSHVPFCYFVIHGNVVSHYVMRKPECFLDLFCWLENLKTRGMETLQSFATPM